MWVLVDVFLLFFLVSSDRTDRAGPGVPTQCLSTVLAGLHLVRVFIYPGESPPKIGKKWSPFSYKFDSPLSRQRVATIFVMLK